MFNYVLELALKINLSAEVWSEPKTGESKVV